MATGSVLATALRAAARGLGVAAFGFALTDPSFFVARFLAGMHASVRPAARHGIDRSPDDRRPPDLPEEPDMKVTVPTPALLEAIGHAAATAA
jgi:hypothetical protein